MLKAATNKVMNLLLPPRCISCGELVNDVGSLCGKCWAEIDFINEPLCISCGYPLEPTAGKNSICGHCIMEEPPYKAGRSVFCYNDKSKSLILDFKYSDKIQSAKRYATWMLNSAKDLIEDSDYIVPVPLHWRRLVERRYNQAAIISNEIAKISGKKVLSQGLIRKKYTPPQVSLTRKQRLKNVKGAFAVNPRLAERIKGKKLVLVDDVMTTGATINECVEILNKAGAAAVFVVTLGRTVEGR